MLHLKKWVNQLKASNVTTWINAFCVIYLVYLYYYYLNTGFYGDDYFLINAGDIPFSLKYLIGIFSGPNSGPQYRPLSFYGYFKFMANFSGHLYLFPLVNVTLIALLVRNSGKLVYQLTKNKLYSALAKILILLTPLFFFFNEYSKGFKYLLPISIFFYTLESIVRDEILTIRKLTLLILLEAICVFTHEASFVFPIAYFVAYILKNKRLPRKELLILLPTIFYLLLRVFIFKLPRSGGFTVDIGNIWNGLTFHLTYITQLVSFDSFYTFSFVTFALIYLFAKLYGQDKPYFKKCCLILLTLMLLIAPFSVIPIHQSNYHSFWGSVVYMLLITMLLWTARKQRTLVFGLWILVLIGLIKSNDSMRVFSSERSAYSLERINNLRKNITALIKTNDHHVHFKINVHPRYLENRDVTHFNMKYHVSNLVPPVIRELLPPNSQAIVSVVSRDQVVQQMAIINNIVLINFLIDDSPVTIFSSGNYILKDFFNQTHQKSVDIQKAIERSIDFDDLIQTQG